MKTLLAILILFLPIPMHGQDHLPVSISLQFEVVYNGSPIDLSQPVFIGSKSEITLQKFKCYLSNFSLFDTNNHVHNLHQLPLLIDASSQPKTNSFNTDSVNFKPNYLNFYLGIDSATNVSANMDGTLDPLNGMYWTWQSGYINLKLEGSSTHCPTRKNEFKYHLGGYQSPNTTLQKIHIPLSNAPHQTIQIELKHFLDQIDFVNTPIIMSPGPEAKKLSIQAKKLFHNNEQE